MSKIKSDYRAAAMAKLAMDITLFVGLAIFFGFVLAIGVTGA